MHLHGGQSRMLGVILCHILLYFLETGSHWIWSLLFLLGWLANKFSGSFCLCSLLVALQACVAVPNFLQECLGPELSSSCLQSNHSCLLNQLSIPMDSFEIWHLDHNMFHYQYIHSGFEMYLNKLYIMSITIMSCLSDIRCGVGLPWSILVNFIFEMILGLS